MALKLNGIISKKTKKSPTQQDYSQHLTSKPIVALTTVAHKSEATHAEWMGEPSESQIVHPGLFVSHGMSFAITGGRTLNLGNFEFARIDVTITVPCDPENLMEAWDWGSNWVSEKIEEAVKLAKGL